MGVLENVYFKVIFKLRYNTTTNNNNNIGLIKILFENSLIILMWFFTFQNGTKIDFFIFNTKIKQKVF